MSKQMSEYSDSAQRWLDRQEGHQVPDAQGNKSAYCDSCAEPIRPGTDVQMYFSDTSFHSGEAYSVGTMTPMALYCDDCHRFRLLLPAEGVNELLLAAEIDEEGKLWNFDVVDSSPADKGVPWDPAEMMSDTFSYPIQMWARDANTFLAPGDVADLMLCIGLDPREYVDLETGEPTLDDAKRQEARKLLVQHAKNSAESGTHDRVMRKGDRQDEWMAEQVGLPVEEIRKEGTKVYYSAEQADWVVERDGDD